MRDRDAALKRASKSKKDKHKKQARNIINLVNHYVKRARSEFLKEQLENLKDKQKIFWNILNDIINPGKQANDFKLTDIKGNCMGDMEAAKSINKFFAQVGKKFSSKDNKGS